MWAPFLNGNRIKNPGATLCPNLFCDRGRPGGRHFAFLNPKKKTAGPEGKVVGKSIAGSPEGRKIQGEKKGAFF